MRAAVLALVLLASACGAAYGPEQELLSSFFQAARVRDRIAVARLSTVPFEPQTAGSVQDFTITSVVHGQGSELVTVDAMVRTLQGMVAARTFVIVLEPAPAHGRGDPQASTGGAQTAGPRWVITSIRQQDAPGASRTRRGEAA